MKILALGAHPDDIEFGCAHLLLLERGAGHSVAMLVLSRGEAGTAGTPDLRENEARSAAAELGAEIAFLDCGGDCHIEATPAHAIAVARQVRAFRPDLMLAPHPRQNQHPDHAAAGKLARDACRLARYGGLAELRPDAPHRVANLLFYAITDHSHAFPDLVFDISSVVEPWQRLMRCHASQTGAATAPKPYLELQLTAARLLGLQAGVPYAAGLFLNDPARLERPSQLVLSARNF